MKNSKLILGSIAGLLNVMVIFGASLFWPNGGFDYPLAWIYLTIYFVCAIIFTVYLYLNDKHLLRSRLKAGPGAEKRPEQKIILIFLWIFFFGEYVLSAFDYSRGWSDVPLWLSYVSDGIVVLSFVLLFMVVRYNSFLSSTVEVQQDQQVVSTGPYGIVRHPMYAVMSLMMTFTPMALGSYWGLVAAFLLIIAMVFRTFDEEKELRANLAGYEDYCRKVRYRFIPYLF